MKRIADMQKMQDRVEQEAIWTGQGVMDAQQVKETQAKDEVLDITAWNLHHYTLKFLSDLSHLNHLSELEAMSNALAMNKEQAVLKLVESATINKVINYARTSKYTIAE